MKKLISELTNSPSSTPPMFSWNDLCKKDTVFLYDRHSHRLIVVMIICLFFIIPAYGYRIRGIVDLPNYPFTCFITTFARDGADVFEAF